MSLAQISDVDKAVAAAKEAFEEGEWGKMNPRDRGRLIYKSVHLFILNLILVIRAQLKALKAFVPFVRCIRCGPCVSTNTMLYGATGVCCTVNGMVFQFFYWVILEYTVLSL